MFSGKFPLKRGEAERITFYPSNFYIHVLHLYDYALGFASLRPKVTGVSLYDAHIKFILLYARLRLAAGDAMYDTRQSPTRMTWRILFRDEASHRRGRAYYNYN